MKCAEKERPDAPPFEPESPYVIVCEGWQDASFVCALLKDLGITNCDVTYPTQNSGGNGKSAIGKVVELLAGRASTLQGVAIIADADPDPEKSFNDACKCFVSPFIAPSACFAITDGKRHRTAVFLIPGKDKTGALEHLFLDAITQVKADALQCVDAYRDCCKTTTGWSENMIGKMRLTAYVAANCEANPACSPAFLWTSKHQVFEITNPAFQEIRDFLTAFSTPPPPDPNKHADKPL